MREAPAHTAALPPSANWPTALKQLALASLGGRVTWELWARPFIGETDEPAWCLLRRCARQIAGTFRVVTNDEAWNICLAYLERDRARKSRAA